MGGPGNTLGFNLSLKEYKNTHHYFFKMLKQYTWYGDTWWQVFKNSVILAYTEKFVKESAKKQLTEKSGFNSCYLEYTVLPWLHWVSSGKLKWLVNLICHPDYVFMWVGVCDYWQAVGPTLTQMSPGCLSPSPYTHLSEYLQVGNRSATTGPWWNLWWSLQRLNLWWFWDRCWFLPCSKQC